MRKKIIFFIVVAALCFAAWGFYLYKKPRESIINITPEITITAMQLYNEYMQNEATANKQYLNKIIAVKGHVASVDKTDSAVNVLMLPSDTATGGISCNIKANGQQIQQGNSIVIKGRCTGFLTDVMLTDCVVVK